MFLEPLLKKITKKNSFPHLGFFLNGNGDTIRISQEI